MKTLKIFSADICIFSLRYTVLYILTLFVRVHLSLVCIPYEYEPLLFEGLLRGIAGKNKEGSDKHRERTLHDETNETLTRSCEEFVPRTLFTEMQSGELAKTFLLAKALRTVLLLEENSLKM